MVRVPILRICHKPKSPKGEIALSEATAPKKRRAARGAGSIYWSEKHQCYVGQISLGTDENGKRLRPTFYGQTKAEVQQQMDEAKRKHMLGRFVPGQTPTVKAHFESFLDAKKEQLAPTTYSQYEHRYERHIKPLLGNIELKKLDYERIEAFYKQLRENGLSPRTIYDVAALLRQGLNDAVKKGILPNNQAKVAASPRLVQEEARFLSHEEVRIFFQAAQGEELREFFTLALHTGLRASELLGLAWNSVDIESRKLTVRQAMHEVRGIMRLGNVKTKASRRTISLSQEAVEALKSQRKKQAKAQLAAGSKWDNSQNLVFTSRVGTPLIRTNITKRTLRRILNRAAIIKAAERHGYYNYRELIAVNKVLPARAMKAGDAFKLPDGRIASLEADDIMEGVGIHSFRHTHASMLIAAGTDILTVSRRLGHENIRITLDLYGHLLPGQDEAAAAVMDKLSSAWQS